MILTLLGLNDICCHSFELRHSLSEIGIDVDRGADGIELLAYHHIIIARYLTYQDGDGCYCINLREQQCYFFSLFHAIHTLSVRPHRVI